jgi:hypothetical protein
MGAGAAAAPGSATGAADSCGSWQWERVGRG